MKLSPTPPVNESWEEEFDNLGVPDGDTEPDGQGGYTASHERLINTLTKQQGSVIKSFIQSLLSTARQEATLIEKEVSDSHKKLYDQLKDKPSYDAYSNDYKHGILRGYTLIARFIDSLTSKGGTNG